MRSFTILLLLLTSTPFLYSQKNTFISYEIGLSHTKYSFHGNTNLALSARVETAIPMGLITQEITKNFYVETGYTTDYTIFSFVDKTADKEYWYSLFYRNGKQIPLRVQFRLPLFNHKFSLYTLSGVSYSFGLKENNLGMNNNDYFTVTDFYMQRDFFLGQLGVGLDFNCGKNIYIGVKFQRDFAFQDTVDIKGYIENQTPFSIRHRAHASMFSFRVGYRISSLWNTN